ncbi:stigma-specific STIG1-like protein 1 [Ziziphus jujuba]|uniref:Stigma-specific STIG1-like protein 1 n=2 Tax=Ziziphus jujuba TaxID=326968 RepID=A0A978W176_ZIZJJ|nr:stigma-specific STIG1-like protein 1 [Ziziphus jujuba]XP_048323328.1 stigma-specific STIG1-like protein 1 [Ziziphus jujuba]KAH7545708.1 hypothetical protein FEM48_Zijuj01G0122400 [Ziziphus jujuba var. spinosa]KAH7545710.1 hypothetical protein FEM48_Zijuj01G0122600 [Ziziphus jujuba var. spinosa]
MKSQKLFLLLAILIMALSTIALSATPNADETFLNNDEDDNATTDEDSLETEDQRQTTLTPLRGISRLLASRNQMTCNKYPKVCRAKDSPGPDCCKKKCVDTSSDRVNCGKCGKKCKYAEICCKGKCVKPMTDEKHCGSCNNRCGKGNKCSYGMCNYA